MDRLDKNTNRPVNIPRLPSENLIKKLEPLYTLARGGDWTYRITSRILL